MITRERLQQMEAEVDEAQGKFAVAFKELQQENIPGVWGVYENIKDALDDWRRVALNPIKSTLMTMND